MKPNEYKLRRWLDNLKGMSKSKRLSLELNNYRNIQKIELIIDEKGREYTKTFITGHDITLIHDKKSNTLRITADKGNHG